MYMKERAIPSNLEAEKSVIGAMFLSKYAIQRSVESLNKDMFYSNAHAKIFEVICDLFEKSIPIDSTTVVNELDKKNYLNEIGGVEYLSDIINFVPSANNIDEYIKIVTNTLLLLFFLSLGSKLF